MELVAIISSAVIAVVAVIWLMVGLVRWLVNRAKWTQKVDSDSANFSTFMKELRGEIKELRKDIQHIFNLMPPIVSSRGSPERLTEFGKQVSEKIAAKACVSEIAPLLIWDVKGMQPFEIHTFSREYMRTEFVPTDEQNYLFSQVIYEEGIEPKDVSKVLEIELRDQLIALTQEADD